MITVIGPQDSVALVRQVAAELGMDGHVMTRAYELPNEALQLARELDHASDVVLFTGRLPYALVSADGPFSARHDYIPHEGGTLYGTLARLLLTPRFAGRVPDLSLDTIEVAVANEAFRDLGVPPPRYVLPLDHVYRGSRYVLDGIARRHRELYEAGEVEVCLTCVAAVYEALSKDGIPVERVCHVRTAVREALMRSQLVRELNRAEATQVAVCVLERSARAKAGDASSAVSLRYVADQYAQMLSGTITQLSEDGAVIHTTRGAVEQRVGGSRSGVSLLTAEFRDVVHVGIGLGRSLPTAGRHAREALVFARRHQAPHLYFEDGAVVSVDGRISVAARETDPETLRNARELGMSPTSLQRVVAALRQLDRGGFTAKEFADAYGVTPRSARRLISRLESAALVRHCGTAPGAGAGRPQSLYCADMDRMLGG